MTNLMNRKQHIACGGRDSFASGSLRPVAACTVITHFTSLTIRSGETHLVLNVLDRNRSETAYSTVIEKRTSEPTLQAAYRQKDWSVSGGCYPLAFVELDMTRHSAHIVRVKQRHRSRIAHFNETQIDDATAVSRVQSIKTV